MNTKSAAEEMLALQLRALGLPFVREHRFHPTRRWRFDFANLGRYIAIEVEGIHRFDKTGKPTKHPGRHRSAEGIEADCEKYAEAILLGWRVLRVTPGMVRSGRAVGYVEKLMI